MPIYIIYDRKDGRILQTHREYYMGAKEPSELEHNEVLALAKDGLPEDSDPAVLAVDDFRPQRGYHDYVDLGTGELLRVEAPPKEEKSA
jgi:hypothetical protein